MEERKVSSIKKRPSFSPSPRLSGCFRTPLSTVDSNRRPLTKSITVNRLRCERQPSVPRGPYTFAIYESLIDRQGELITSPSLCEQFTPENRNRLVVFMGSLSENLSFTRSALHVAVSLLDRSITTIAPSEDDFKAFAVSCLFIAAKFSCPKNSQLERIIEACGDQLKKNQVLDFEIEILNATNFSISIPNVCEFMDLSEPYLSFDRKIITSARFLCDYQLRFWSFKRFLPSTIATAIVIYTLYSNDEPIQNKVVKNLLIYEDWKALFFCIEELDRIIGQAKRSSFMNVQMDHYATIFNELEDFVVPTVSEYLALFPQVDLE